VGLGVATQIAGYWRSLYFHVCLGPGATDADAANCEKYLARHVKSIISKDVVFWNPQVGQKPTNSF
jgi:hypothetical protein